MRVFVCVFVYEFILSCSRPAGSGYETPTAELADNIHVLINNYMLSFPVY